MNPRLLRAIQNSLIAALTVVLALVVLFSFLRIVRPKEPAQALGTTTTTLDGSAIGSTTTTPPPTDTTTTTTTTVPFTGSCDAPRPQGGDDVTLLRIYFSCADPNGPPRPDTYVVRAVPQTAQVLTATLGQMLAGPSPAETAVGYSSFFSGDTARQFRGVTISDGVAVVDFQPELLDGFEPTETAVDHLLSDLNANVFQFDTIVAVEYRLGGDCNAFWEAIGASGCTIITRADWNRTQAAWRSG